MSCFARYDVLYGRDNLVAMTTGDVAVKKSNGLLSAGETGTTVIKEFVNGSLINKEVKFRDSVKQIKAQSSCNKGREISLVVYCDRIWS